MFFIQVLGRRSKSHTVYTLDELGDVVTKELADMANNCIVVAVGRTDKAVMPYAWIRRNDEDQWEGELGDCIRLGIDDGLLVETDPIQLMGINQAVARGIAAVADEGSIRVVTMNQDVPKPPPKKLSNEEKLFMAKNMVDDLFINLRLEDEDDS
jgi:hypothetical protein